MNQKKFAELTDYSYSAVKGWEEAPKWVEFVLNYFEVIKSVEDMEIIADSIEIFKEKVQNLDLSKRL